MTDPDFAQRTLLGLLLEAHPAMLSLDDVRGRLSDIPNVDEAIEHLVRDGLINRLGEMVGVSRTAVRTDQLTL